MQVVETIHDTVQDERQPELLNIALVGGGSGCKALIQFLETHILRHIHVHIIGVAGAHKHAPGLAYAREKGIYTTSDYRNLFDLENLHLIIELTGRDDVLREIVRSKPKHLKVMDHLSARLFWELIELQEEKTRCEKRLVRANQLTSVGRMASYLAHEIRNPLVSIGGFADNILEAPELPSSLKPKAQIIVDEVRKLERVLKKMWEYIRPLKKNATKHNYNEVVEKAFRILEPEFRSRGVDITLKLDRGMPDSLFDLDLILDALLSVARGLMVLMESGQKFSVRTEICWDTVGVYFEAKGGVISTHILEEMFNPFSDHQETYTGLAVAMSKKIVDDHGGDIKIASEEGVGTTIIIELPIER